MVWTAIPDSDIDPDSPITTGLMTALRDNTVEVAEGSGGPRIHPSSALDDTITTEGSQAMGTGTTWTTPQGFYNITASAGTTGYIDLYVSAAWRTGTGPAHGTTFMDGVNMRLRNAAPTTQTVYWQRFDG